MTSDYQAMIIQEPAKVEREYHKEGRWGVVHSRCSLFAIFFFQVYFHPAVSFDHQYLIEWTTFLLNWKLQNLIVAKDDKSRIHLLTISLIINKIYPRDVIIE